MEIIFALVLAIALFMLIAASMITVAVFAFDKALQYSESGRNNAAMATLFVGVWAASVVGLLGAYLASLLGY